MASDFDRSEFVDHDYLESQQASSVSTPQQPVSSRAPMKNEELDSRVHAAQSKIQELREAQEKLEKERTALEEARRQRGELTQGHDEMLDRLPKGIKILEDRAFKARQDSEQMTKALDGLQQALAHVKSIDRDAWTEENYKEELSRALGVIENARMEWNSCRLKWPVLDSQAKANHEGAAASSDRRDSISASLSAAEFRSLCRMGLGLTWPVALAILLLGGTALGVWLSR